MVAIVPSILKGAPGSPEEQKTHASLISVLQTFACASILILAFPIFLLGACLVRIFILPISKIVVRGEHERQQLIREIIGLLLRMFFGTLKRLGVLAVQIHGDPESVPTKSLLVANHPSLLDALVFFAWVPDVVCITKQTVLSWPVFGPIARAAGFISNADIHEVLEKSDRVLRSGCRLLIFPEGTRSAGGTGLRTFNTVGVGLAVRYHVPVVPAIICCSSPCLYRGQSLKELLGELLERRFEITVTLCDSWGPFEAGEDLDGQRQLRAEITRRLYDFFDERLYG